MQPAPSFRMPFGKYKGTLVSALPDDYLAWLVTREDLRDPLRAALARECQVRGSTSAPRPLATRLHEAQARGFFLVPAGHEAEVREYHDWCVATGTPSVCVSVGQRSAMIAIVFFGVSMPASSLSRIQQTLEARWHDYEPQHLPPHSFVLLSVPEAVVEEIAAALSALAREACLLSPDEQGSEADRERTRSFSTDPAPVSSCLARVVPLNYARADEVADTLS